jgi:hypothetical protein
LSEKFLYYFAYFCIFGSAFASATAAYYREPFWLVVVFAVIAVLGTILLHKSQGTNLHWCVPKISKFCSEGTPSGTGSGTVVSVRRGVGAEDSSGGIRVRGEEGSIAETSTLLKQRSKAEASV